MLKIIRSKRRTISIEVLPDEFVLVRAPFCISKSEIKNILLKKRDWIEKKQREFESRPLAPSITQRDVLALRETAKKIIPERVLFWSRKTGLNYSSVKITSARNRFGSCNSKNGLCFSLFLALYPMDLIDFVIVHELCHTKEHNHSLAFYNLLSFHLPDWKQRQEQIRKQPIPVVLSDEN